MRRGGALLVLLAALAGGACDGGEQARAEAEYLRDRVADLENDLELTRAALAEANDVIVTAQDQIQNVRSVADDCDSLQDEAENLEDVDEVDEPW